MFGGILTYSCSWLKVLKANLWCMLASPTMVRVESSSSSSFSQSVDVCSDLALGIVLPHVHCENKVR